METIIKDLYPMYRGLLGAGYDNALEYLKMLLPFEVIKVPSGTKLETWTVPMEWVPLDAWVKLNGEKIIDFKVHPLALMQGSIPFKGKVDVSELKNHLYTDPDKPSVTPYAFKFYENKWGFSIPYDQYVLLVEGEYEVNIETEERKGDLKISVHTIPGKTDREILLFAHLDHPYQANDNLSGVACLMEFAKYAKAEHTLKIIFCPETIGSIAYAKTQDISKVDAVIAVDICGNKNDEGILLQKAFDRKAKINVAMHLALTESGQSYRKADFRAVIGSDEYFFNDPTVNIPGIMLSTYPYREYHTSEDTPEKIDYTQITEVKNAIQRAITIFEQDFVPVRKFSGPLMRSRYNYQFTDKNKNLYLDYFFYSMDGKLSLAELCMQYNFGFKDMYGLLTNMEADGFISRAPASQKGQRKTAK